MEIDRLAALAEKKAQEEEIIRLRQVLQRNENEQQANRNAGVFGFWPGSSASAPVPSTTAPVSPPPSTGGVAPPMNYISSPLDIINFLFSSRPTNVNVLARLQDNRNSDADATVTRVLHV